jgi:4-alpha-glucanotransferase
MQKRASGIFLHITSLPSKYGIGDLGPWAYRFANLLIDSKQSYWQILPLTPTMPKYGNSPYSTCSSFAGNALLISPEQLIKEDLLPDSFREWRQKNSSKRINYIAVSNQKKELIKKAYGEFKKRFQDYSSEFENFCEMNSKWLDDHALFMAIYDKEEKPWYLWPSHLRNRDRRELNETKKQLRNLINQEKFVQFIFHKQWHKFKEFCKNIGLSIIGDLPFYVNYDSVDVWAHHELFKLNQNRGTDFVSGVPPDYFSEDGQLWGNPIYDWKQLTTTRYRWWIDRLQNSLIRCDKIRLDHFRGYLSFWEIPVGSKASEGSWVKAPSRDFFSTLGRYFPNQSFIAEDLGFITSDVREAIRTLGIPGMKVILFAFRGSSDNSHLPHNHSYNYVVHTGTHDTNTARGWFNEELGQNGRNQLEKYVGKEISDNEVSWEIIKLAMISPAFLSIIPIQDMLSLGSEARMNHPTTTNSNWEWRITADQVKNKAFENLGETTETFGRY